MTMDLLQRPPAPAHEPVAVGPAPAHPTVWQRWRWRRQEAAAGRRTVEARDRAACLAGAAAALARTAEVLDAGWVQGAWFHVRVQSGRRGVLPLAPPLPARRQVTGACLVGAVVRATDGSGLGPQLTHAALDVVWDALQDTLGATVRRASGRACPPAERTLRVRELTRWNDAAGRSRADVAALVEDARRLALRQAGLPAGVPG